MRIILRKNIFIVLICIIVILLTGCKGKLNEEEFVGEKVGFILNIDNNIVYNSKNIIFDQKVNVAGINKEYYLSSNNMDFLILKLKEEIKKDVSLEVTFIDSVYNKMESLDDNILKQIQKKYDIDLLLVMKYSDLEYDYKYEYDIDYKGKTTIGSEGMDYKLSRKETKSKYNESRINFEYILYDLPSRVIVEGEVKGAYQKEEEEKTDNNSKEIFITSPASITDGIIDFDENGIAIIYRSIKKAIRRSLLM